MLSGANDLATISQTPASNHGTLVSSIISGDVTDANPEALSGMAVTSVDDTNGIWEYSTNAGDTWTDFISPSTTTALLLAADDSTYVRFVPDAGWSGTDNGGLTFRAWNQTSGTAGETVDTTINGGSSAFSSATAAASITVNPTLHVVDVTTTADNDDSGIVLGDSAEDINWLEANIGPDNAISLREAIIAVDNTPGADTIDFKIPGSGIQTITVNSACPWLRIV